MSCGRDGEAQQSPQPEAAREIDCWRLRVFPQLRYAVQTSNVKYEQDPRAWAHTAASISTFREEAHQQGDKKSQLHVLF